MATSFDSAKAKAHFKEWTAKLIDADLSARADRVVEAAQGLVPKRSGRLHDSIRKERFPNPRKPGYRIFADAKGDGQDNSYALAVELGHVKRSAAKVTSDDENEGTTEAPAPGFVQGQPYLVPALEAAKD